MKFTTVKQVRQAIADLGPGSYVHGFNSLYKGEHPGCWYVVYINHEVVQGLQQKVYKSQLIEWANKHIA